MNLCSCKQCGVVVDLDKVTTQGIILEDGSFSAECGWDGDTPVQTWACPACKYPNLSDNEPE